MQERTSFAVLAKQLSLFFFSSELCAFSFSWNAPIVPRLSSHRARSHHGHIHASNNTYICICVCWRENCTALLHPKVAMLYKSQFKRTSRMLSTKRRISWRSNGWLFWISTCTYILGEKKSCAHCKASNSYTCYMQTCNFSRTKDSLLWPGKKKVCILVRRIWHIHTCCGHLR